MMIKKYRDAPIPFISKSSHYINLAYFDAVPTKLAEPNLENEWGALQWGNSSFVGIMTLTYLEKGNYSLRLNSLTLKL